jgi:restriction endonuclease Mrr
MDEVPTLGKLIIPVLQIIKQGGGSATNDQIFDGLLKMGIPKGPLHKGGPRTVLEYRTAWARSYLKVFGGLENPKRGVWNITEKGHGIGPEHVNDLINFVVYESRKQAKAKVQRKVPKAKRARGSATSDTEPGTLSAVDQARVIISLVDKGILTKGAANLALRQLNGELR